MKFKKLICFLMCCATAFSFCACAKDNPPENGGGGGGGEETLPPTLKTADEVYNSLTDAQKICSEYSLDKYMQSIFTSQVIYNESVVPYADKEGNAIPRKLAFKIGRILEVRSNDLKTLFLPGSDYEVDSNGLLSFPQGSKVPIQNFDSIFSTSAFGPVGFKSIMHDRYILTGQNLIKMQIHVSYIRDTAFGAEPTYKGDSLSSTIGRMKGKQEVNIVFHGDSITTGSSSSGFFGIEPNAPIFSQLVQDKLRNLYGYEGINVHNTATGGWTSKDGEVNISRVLSKKPNLVVLAFGMNDGGGQKSNAAKNAFYVNHISMIEKVKKQYPASEFLLIATMLPNPDALDQEGNKTLSNHEDFLEVAQQIAEEYENDGIAVCDVMTTHKWLLQNKMFMDMGDNYNHPSDFAARLYAQSIVTNLNKEYGTKETH